jgi:flavorubredoxin
MTDLLIVSFSRTGGTDALRDAVIAGAREAGVEPRVLGCFDADVDDVRVADGIVLGTPAHFGYMSGALKDLFERIYRPLLDETVGTPWGLFVKGESDVEGAVTSVERIVTGLGWKQVLPHVRCVGAVTDEHLEAAFELGGAFAAGLDAGMF